jgi:hypothetical protein
VIRISGSPVSQNFHFAGTTSNKDADQKRMGVISTDGESISSVELIMNLGFKEVKQIEFSPVSGTDPRDTSPVPRPAAFPLFAGALGGLGVLGRWRKRRASATVALWPSYCPRSAHAALRRALARSLLCSSGFRCRILPFARPGARELVPLGLPVT